MGRQFYKATLSSSGTLTLPRKLLKSLNPAWEPGTQIAVTVTSSNPKAILISKSDGAKPSYTIQQNYTVTCRPIAAQLSEQSPLDSIPCWAIPLDDQDQPVALLTESLKWVTLDITKADDLKGLPKKYGLYRLLDYKAHPQLQGEGNIREIIQSVFEEKPGRYILKYHLVPEKTPFLQLARAAAHLPRKHYPEDAYDPGKSTNEFYDCMNAATEAWIVKQRRAIGALLAEQENFFSYSDDLETAIDAVLHRLRQILRENYREEDNFNHLIEPTLNLVDDTAERILEDVVGYFEDRYYQSKRYNNRHFKPVVKCVVLHATRINDDPGMIQALSNIVQLAKPEVFQEATDGVLVRQPLRFARLCFQYQMTLKLPRSPHAVDELPDPLPELPRAPEDTYEKLAQIVYRNMEAPGLFGRLGDIEGYTVDETIRTMARTFEATYWDGAEMLFIRTAPGSATPSRSQNSKNVEDRVTENYQN